jgi:1,4-dihydroxy-2-naphthoate octaprenyltransferase
MENTSPKKTNKGIAYIKATRLPFVSASAFSSLVAVGWAWAYGSEFHPAFALAAVFGVVLLHLGANTINDYHDWDRSDRINLYPTPFSGGSRNVVEGIIERSSFLTMSLTFFLVSYGLAYYLVLQGRPHVLGIGAAGLLCGVLYSILPLSLMSQGFGELVIFFAFGPLITLGTGYAIEGRFTPGYFAIGIPVGLLVANILWINEFPDVEADGAAGKRNLVVRLGTARSRFGHAVLFAGAYLSVLALWAARLLPAWSLITFLTLPIAAKAVANAWKNHADPRAIVPSQAATILTQGLFGLLLTLSLFLNKLL